MRHEHRLVNAYAGRFERAFHRIAHVPRLRQVHTGNDQDSAAHDAQHQGCRRAEQRMLVLPAAQHLHVARCHQHNTFGMACRILSADDNSWYHARRPVGLRCQAS
jgi:hypothetical protein